MSDCTAPFAPEARHRPSLSATALVARIFSRHRAKPVAASATAAPREAGYLADIGIAIDL